MEKTFRQLFISKKLRVLLLLLSLIGLWSCQDDEISPFVPIEGDVITEAELIREFNDKNALDAYVLTTPNVGIDQDLLLLFVEGGARVYRITYRTQDTDGQAILASGALLVPAQISDPLPLVSVQHGTITDQRDAPSAFDRSVEATIIAPIVASRDFVVVLPDYIGYGASSNLPHPYEHGESLASVSLDLMRAAKEFCASQNIPLTDQALLTGYSEGGYATMALHKKLEEEARSEFTVVASAPGAGAYHKTAFAQFVSSANEDLNFLRSYLWVLDTYNQVYDLNRPWSFYLNEPYASNVASQGFFEADIDFNPQNLFRADFIEATMQETDSSLVAAFTDNNRHDWRPQAPVRLFHGTIDDFVPYFNSQDAFDAMQARGATQVTIGPLENRDHFTGQGDFIFAAISYLESFL